MAGSLKHWLVVGLLLGTAVYALAEDITLTTYYPSPRGVYQELRTAGNVQIGTIDPPAGTVPRLHVVQDDPASTAPVFRADDETTPDATPFIITSEGDVGIGGTPAPTQKLTVIGDARIEGTVSAQAFGSLSPLIFEIQGVEHMRITDDGDVGIGTTAPAGRVDVRGVNDAASIITFMPGTDTGAAGTPSLNVGIGTTSPGQKLQVKGNAVIEPDPLQADSGQLRLGNLDNDPAAIGDGAIYYNTTDNQFRGFKAGTWQGLVGGALELMSGSNPVCGAGQIPLARRIIPFEAKRGWPGACNYNTVICAGWTGTQWSKVGEPIPAETSTPANCGAGVGAHPTTTCQEYCNVTLGYPLGVCDFYDGANGPNGTPAWDMVLCVSP